MRIGIDLGGTKIEGVVLGHEGQLLARKRIATPRNDYRGVIDAIAGLVESLEGEVGSTCTVGIGTPGARSPATGMMKNCNSTWLNGQPLDGDLEIRLSRPVRMANDADCFALSEATDGAAAGAGIVFGVIVGTGTGGGVVVNGRLVSGPNAIGGEWGHNALPWPRTEELPGAKCYCGQRGCIETWLSGPGLARDHFEHTGREMRGEEIVRRAEGGDSQSEATLERYADRMARALASIINVIDPHVIVLGGGLSSIRYVYQRVPELWARYVFSDRVDTALVPPRYGDASGVRGAAWLWPAEED